MDQNQRRLRTLLLNISNKLSHANRVSLAYLLVNDVPRRDLDTVSQDSRASMNIIWDALINRHKISVNNVDYLITCFEDIQRMDLVRLLKQYPTAPKSENPVGKPRCSSDLFNRYDP